MAGARLRVVTDLGDPINPQPPAGSAVNVLRRHRKRRRQGLECENWVKTIKIWREAGREDAALQLTCSGMWDSRPF